MTKMIIGVPDPLTIPAVDTIDYVEWEFSRSPTFLTILDRVTVTKPGDNLAYGYMIADTTDVVARCRFGTEAGLTDWVSSEVSYNYTQSPQVTVTKSTTGGVTTVSVNTSAYQSVTNEVHTSTDWFLYDHRKVLIRSEKLSPALTNYIPPYEILTPGETYTVCVRHRGDKTVSNLGKTTFVA